MGTVIGFVVGAAVTVVGTWWYIVRLFGKEWHK
jgi:hypothetical protein